MASGKCEPSPASTLPVAEDEERPGGPDLALVEALLEKRVGGELNGSVRKEQVAAVVLPRPLDVEDGALSVSRRSAPCRWHLSSADLRIRLLPRPPRSPAGSLPTEGGRGIGSRTAPGWRRRAGSPCHALPRAARHLRARRVREAPSAPTRAPRHPRSGASPRAYGRTPRRAGGPRSRRAASRPSPRRHRRREAVQRTEGPTRAGSRRASRDSSRTRPPGGRWRSQRERVHQRLGAGNGLIARSRVGTPSGSSVPSLSTSAGSIRTVVKPWNRGS